MGNSTLKIVLRKLGFVFFLGMMVTTLSAQIYVNEVNSTGKWIEIYNAGSTSKDLSGYTVTRNNNDATATSTIPAGTIIPAKGYIVVSQGVVSGAINCLSFGISATKFWNIVLKDAAENIVDATFDIGNPQTVTVSGTQSWGREYDGTATIKALVATLGASNGTPPVAETYKIYVNEINGNEKWLELYNDENKEIDLTGYIIQKIDEKGSTTNWAIPSGTKISAKGFLVWTQDETCIDGSTFTWGISAKKDVGFKLFNNVSTVLDFIDIKMSAGFNSEDLVNTAKSVGRKTDGASELVVFTTGTKGSTNNLGVITSLEPEYLLGKTAFVNSSVLYLPEGASDIKLYNISGMLVLSMNEGVDQSVDLHGLVRGIYVLKLTVSGKSIVQKIALF